MNRINDFQALPVAGRDDATAQRRQLTMLAAALLDALAVIFVVGLTSVAYHLTVYAHPGDFSVTLELAAALACLFVFINLIQRRYRLSRYLASKGHITDTLNVWNVTIIAFLALGFLLKVSDTYSRAVVLASYVVGVPVVAFARLWLVRLIGIASRSGLVASQRVLLVGSHSDVTSFINQHQPWNRGVMIQEIALIRGSPGGNAADRQMFREDTDFALARARQIKPDAVLMAMPWSAHERIERCIEAFLTVPVAIALTPERILERFENPRILRTGEVLTLELTPPRASLPERWAKRAFDLTIAASAMLCLAPLFLLVAAAIKLDSRGPVLFVQRRFGFNQEPFRIFKFRTMTSLDDGDVVRQATRNDPRITRVGATLRRYNLDELPQLWNVIRGEMSLVGPRPHALAHDREFEAKIALYARRHNVKPGITGWAQVHGLRGETDTDAKMAERVNHDLWYIDNWSIWLDLVILLRTLTTRKAFMNAR